MIYLIRHGQTEWNKNCIFRGQKDIPLSKEGNLQARLTGKYLIGHDIESIYTSPLKRAFETATILAENFKSTVQKVEDLKDINFGNWEGKSDLWVREHDASLYNLYRNFPEKSSFPDGESLNQCFDRAFRAFYSIASQNAQKDIAIVTHRVILKLILIGILGLTTSSFWKIRLDTCSISEVELHKSSFIIKRINSICHLTKLEGESIDF